MYISVCILLRIFNSLGGVLTCQGTQKWNFAHMPLHIVIPLCTPKYAIGCPLTKSSSIYIWCTVGQKKRNTAIYFNTTYRREMKLVPIIMDYCLL